MKSENFEQLQSPLNQILGNLTDHARDIRNLASNTVCLLNAQTIPIVKPAPFDSSVD